MFKTFNFIKQSNAIAIDSGSLISGSVIYARVP